MAIDGDSCPPRPLDLNSVHLYPMLELRTEGGEKQESDLSRGSPPFVLGFWEGE